MPFPVQCVCFTEVVQVYVPSVQPGDLLGSWELGRLWGRKGKEDEHQN